MSPNPINVASVPQRSPFRYPGGKTWLVPFARQWLQTLRPRPIELIEPFAGGGIIGLTAAFEGLADHVTLVELDDDVASVWQAILSDEAANLADDILDFELSLENVTSLLSRPAKNLRERAFQTIVRNRVNRGGILAAGAGMIKTGEAGKGIASRWYPETLKRRILAIAAMRHRISFVHGDGIEIICQNAHRAAAAFLIDPPYTAGGKKAGSRLYTHWQIDHPRLFDLVTALPGHFLMTYDEAAPIRELADSHHLDTHLVPMKNTHHARMMELVVGRDLRWARR